MFYFPRLLAIIISVLVVVTIISGYQGSLHIELTLPGGGARVHLDGPANFQGADRSLNSSPAMLTTVSTSPTPIAAQG
jgi:hypothetical protein